MKHLKKIGIIKLSKNLLFSDKFHTLAISIGSGSFQLLVSESWSTK